MTRQEAAADLIAAIRNLEEGRQIDLLHDIEATYPGELPEMTEDAEADIAAIETWGA